MADSLPQVQPHAAHKLTLADGTTVDLLITWGLLFRLRSENEDAYRKVADYLSGDSKDKLLGMTEVLYGAYLCGVIEGTGTTSGAMSYVEFLDALPDDEGLVEPLTYVQALVAPKAGRGSAARSRRAQRG